MDIDKKELNVEDMFTPEEIERAKEKAKQEIRQQIIY